MVAPAQPEPGVYRYPFLIDGRPAFYIVDWHGVECEPVAVGDDEGEDEVVAELSNALWVTRPKRISASSKQRRPLLRLL